MSNKCGDLASAPERFGFFIAERPLPAVDHAELPTHCAERRRPTTANRHELRDRATMSFDHDIFAIFDEVEEFGQLCLGAVNAHIHRTRFSPFFGLKRRGVWAKATAGGPDAAKRPLRFYFAVTPDRGKGCQAGVPSSQRLSVSGR